MGLRINTNVASLAAQRTMGSTERSLERSIKQLSSGNRFVSAAEDAAGYAISENLRGQISSLKVSKMNAENANSFIQVAEGGLNEQNNILVRLRELAVQAASDTYSDTERQFLDQEFGQLTEEFDRIATTTKYGSSQLLTGNDKLYEFQVGPNKGPDNVIQYRMDTNTRGDEIGISDLTVKDKNDARDTLQVLDKAILKIGQARSNFGAVQSRLSHVVDNAEVQIQNVTEAHSRMADTDIAAATADFTKNQMMMAAQIAVLAQANRYSPKILDLLS